MVFSAFAARADAVDLGVGRRVGVPPDGVVRRGHHRAVADDDRPERRLPGGDPLAGLLDGQST